MLKHILLASAIGLQNMISDCNNKLQEDIDNNIKDYWNACDLPRKTKKKIRKQAQKEFNLNMSILNWNKINYYDKK